MNSEPGCTIGASAGRGGGKCLLTVYCLLFTPLLDPAPLPAQGFTAHLSARAVFVYDHISDIPGRGSLGEAKLVQPVLMLHLGAWNDRLVLHATANLEGWTMPGGELAPGDWGEGFIDRRHPHTYVHELVLSFNDIFGQLDGPVRTSLSVGKGFAPFGSEDPMNRPTLRFPVNHHLSQILERAVAIVAIKAGPVVAEGGLFDGDEPERPGQWPLLGGTPRRFGDSWSLRLTLHPLGGVEVQGSRAKVHSPEHRPGAGTENFKWSVSARVERPVWGGRGYGMIEWARSEEANGFFVFRSVLAEGAWSKGRHRPYYRFERSERPEDSRTVDLFRSIRPHLENSILGTTRWTINTAGYGHELGPFAQGLTVTPFGEASLAAVAKADAGIFDPKSFYGTDRIWAFSFGVRLGWRDMGHRMGRYGALSEAGHGMEHLHH